MDDELDITAAIKDLTMPLSQSASGEVIASAVGAEATSHPTFGHPTKMMSSLKKKADVFIHQKTRPEHHLGGTKISGPRPPTFQDRKPPPMPMFQSGGPPALTVRNTGDEVFYTDPAKANADLKALLEGGMDDDDDEDEEETPLETRSDNVGATIKSEDGAQAEPEKKKTATNKGNLIEKDGVVAGLSVRLLPHQVEGVNWMRGRELGPVKRGRVPKGGLLADDMGLGKTLQTLALVLTNQKPARDGQGWKKHHEGVAKPTLVVAPLALIRQWEHEIKDKVKASHGLKVLVHHGPQRNKKRDDMALYDVVITTYQILVSEHGKSSPEGPKTGCFDFHWWRVVLDEAHTIKNRMAKTTKACYALRAEYRWCLSGTPMQNNLGELQSLIRFLRIAPYDDIRQWKDHIDLPVKKGKGHVAIRRLHSILRCFMKRRTKAILKESGALRPGGEPSDETGSETPETTDFRVTARNVVNVSTVLSPAERKFYDRLQERADKSMEAMMQSNVSYMNAFTLLLRLRQACNHPILVRGKLANDRDALAVGGSSQRKQEADVDAVADMLAGMGLAAKNCAICGRRLDGVDVELGRENCAACHEDLESFNRQQSLEGKKKTKAKAKEKKKTKKLVKEEQGNNVKKQPEDIKSEKSQQHPSRRRRNRNTIIDSDDEEEDDQGSWLVPDSERGALRLGKAGGQEDEDAEGGGEWLGDGDSEGESGREEEEEESRLDGFVVDDEGESLPSVEEMTQKMASQRLDSDSGKDSDSDSGSDSGSDSDSESSLNSHSKTTPAKAPSSKITRLLHLLTTEAPTHKFIVFSQFTSMLDLVEPHVHRAGLHPRRYDGSMPNDEREESLRLLRSDAAVRVLLCSLKCGSLGLNLTAATRVVILEPFWNPFVEEQAIDRVHRLNQKTDVTIYKLTVADTVEDRILALQDKKRQLAEATIEGAGKGGRRDALKLGLGELIDLFRPAAVSSAQEDIEQDGEARRALAAMARRGGKGRVESEVYGRRW
ncbi:hypothetical protein CDD80_2202 [Ophiocordyceps camponoti-rufipedis]|uniref:Helicase ATP-binding domain-containing protein n=1 Tax=Ophiocordyceps camponoti-rufipedis TaxID=2004952 RepID=A0A2C5XKQ3_9HYPO|nr:hypothetical protein CDD80_2202 [Ophiocordyceps camponoti-rufipedis]